MALTKADLQAMRQADHAQFHLKRDGLTNIRMTIKIGNPPFQGEAEYTIQDLRGHVDCYAGTSESRWGRCDNHVASHGVNVYRSIGPSEWQTMADVLHEDDELHVQWIHHNGSPASDAQGVWLDELNIMVMRKGKRRFLFAIEKTLERNGITCHMVEPAPKYVPELDRYAV